MQIFQGVVIQIISLRCLSKTANWSKYYNLFGYLFYVGNFVVFLDEVDFEFLQWHVIGDLEIIAWVKWLDFHTVTWVYYTFLIWVYALILWRNHKLANVIGKTFDVILEIVNPDEVVFTLWIYHF